MPLLRRLVEEARVAALEALATDGYFAATVAATIERSADHAIVRLKVDTGPRTRVRSVRLDFGAFSPDEKYLYVGNWDDEDKSVSRYEVRPDGTLANRIVFFDMTRAPGEDAIDGVKVDQQGNVYVSGPGGLWILSSTGRHLGTIGGPEHPHNFAWGDEDGKTLYVTAQTGLYRLRLGVAGTRHY
jgi:hypothetical protein